MKCQRCNKELPDGVKFCVYCGNKVVKECPQCKKVIPAEQEICEFCNVNIPLYEENLRLLEEGKELEYKKDYEGAKSVYEKIKGPGIVEASKLWASVTHKLQIINENRTKGNEFLKSKKWSKAKQCFIEIQKLLPSDEVAASGLKLIEARAKQRVKKIWIGVASIIIIGAGIWGYMYTNTIHYLVNKELVRLLNSDNLEVRNSSALILGWHHNKAGVSTLRMLANSGDPRKSVYSLAVLLELDDPVAIPMLRKIMRDGEIPARIGAAYALTKAGDTAIVPELASYLDVANDDLKMAASVLLFNFGYSIGIPLIERMLRDTLPEQKLKALYALYLLGDKNMLTFHEESWVPMVKDLLWDKTTDVKLLAAFLLERFSLTLTSQDSVAIEQIMWESYMRGEKSRPEVEEIPAISAFYIAKGIINRNGDEDICEFEHPAKKIRERCHHMLSRIELNDETAMPELMRAVNSSDKYEVLSAGLTLFKLGKKENMPKLKTLLRDEDEIFRLNVCKLMLEFI